jgi:hypothetical protein
MARLNTSTEDADSPRYFFPPNSSVLAFQNPELRKSFYSLRRKREVANSATSRPACYTAST